MGGDYDVIVCGGGPAGIGAAVTAARNGARTLLVEALASLGGMATAANVCLLCDSEGGPVMDELVRELLRLGAAEVLADNERLHPPGRVRFDAEMFKCVAVSMVREAGAEVLFNTVAESPVMEGRRVAGVTVANKGGRYAVRASVVVDATADGDIAARAGARVMQGDPEDGRIQHCNFQWRVEDIDADAWHAAALAPEAIEALCADALRRGGMNPPGHLFAPTADTFPFDRRTGRLAVSYWELEDIDPTDPAAVSAALAECQAAVPGVVRFCRANLPGFERCRPAAIPRALGTRESRRIVGDSVLTGDDVVAAAKCDDGIARAAFWIDYHDSPPGTTLPYATEYVVATRPAPGDWYEIPFRCLLPAGVDGLLTAGRCISADRAAQASLRIMPTCCWIGASAGLAAAMAVRDGILPREVDGAALKRATVPDTPIAGPERWA